MLTQHRLKEALHYSPSSGDFTWMVSRGAATPRKPAGCAHKSGYVRIVISGKQYKAHRLAWLYVYGSWPKNQIDHINRDKADNRIENLRDVSSKDNCRNQKMSINNASGANGVSFCRRLGKWKVGIHNNGRGVHIGYFNGKLDALAARKSAEVKFKYHENHGAKP